MRLAYHIQIAGLQKHIDCAACADFIFINSSVRGPLLPWYALGGAHWTSLFTRKLSASVKLVGPAISCEHFCLRQPKPGGGTELECRRNAHVQSVAVATDTVRRACDAWCH